MSPFGEDFFFLLIGDADVVLNESLGLLGEDLGLEALEHEDEAGIGIAALVAAVVALDVEDGFLPAFDASACEFGLGLLDAFGVADFVALQLGFFETSGELWAAGQFQIELTFADAFFLDGGMGVAAVYQVFDDAFEERI